MNTQLKSEKNELLKSNIIRIKRLIPVLMSLVPVVVYGHGSNTHQDQHENYDAYLAFNG